MPTTNAMSKILLSSHVCNILLQCVVHSYIEWTEQKRVRAIWQHKATRSSVLKTNDTSVQL